VTFANEAMKRNSEKEATDCGEDLHFAEVLKSVSVDRKPVTKEGGAGENRCEYLPTRTQRGPQV